VSPVIGDRRKTGSEATGAAAAPIRHCRTA
jgi:hypothetical protein